MKDLKELSRISLEVQKDYNAEPKRIERAAQIVRKNQVRPINPHLSHVSHYEIQSQSRNVKYIVDIDTLDCGCKDASKGNLCMHLLAARIYYQLPNTPEQDAWNQKVNAECKRMLQSVGIGG